MKKNAALFKFLMSFILLSAYTVSFAEDSILVNDSATESKTAENNTEEKDRIYVIPTPQIARIRALENSLKNRHLTHQINTLEANGKPFLTLYRPALTSSIQGCAIILHGDNEHPDWPDAVAPLRNTLPKYSWCTVSIEIPDIIKRAEPVSTQIQKDSSNPSTLELPNQAMVFARIIATVNKARSEGMQQFTLLGYKTGAAYALNFLANNQTTIDTVMLINVETPTTVSHYDLAQQIRKVPQAVLDYYIDNNTRNDQFALWRKQAADQRTEIKGDFIQLNAAPDRATGKKSKQLLIQRVRGFLKQNTDQINQKKTLPSIKKGLFYESP